MQNFKGFSRAYGFSESPIIFNHAQSLVNIKTHRIYGSADWWVHQYMSEERECMGISIGKRWGKKGCIEWIHEFPYTFLGKIWLSSPAMRKKWDIAEKYFWSWNWIVLLAEKFELCSHFSEHATLWSNHAEMCVKHLSHYMEDVFRVILPHSR
jgi:hypothetical protein